MTLDEIFGGLPYGFSSFDRVKDKLFDVRAKNRLPENAKTIISVLFPYYLGEEYYEKSNISRYAVSEDYHLVTGAIMKELVTLLSEKYEGYVFEPFVDNSPLPEVMCAVNAGLGVRGRNALFINEDYGSWVFLGEIVTDREFPVFEGETGICKSCNKCVKACPMGAISDIGIEREKCLSFLSQKKGELPDEIKEKMIETGCAWGCDICQKVCPHNINAKTTPIQTFFDTAKPFANIGEDITDRAFAWRGKAVIERNLNATAQ